MRKQLTIRGGLVATIAGYTMLLVLVVGASIAALYMGNGSLEAMYRDDTASLLHLKTSSERMLVLRERMSDVAQIISAGHSGKEEIAKLRTLLKQSNDELDAYAGLHARNADEQALFDTLQNRRRALLDGVFLKALSQLDGDDGFGFLDTQRTAPPALFAAYQEAIDALEAFQVARERRATTRPACSSTGSCGGWRRSRPSHSSSASLRSACSRRRSSSRSSSRSASSRRSRKAT